MIPYLLVWQSGRDGLSAVTHEEWKLEKELPGNELVHDKRAMHEATLMNEFMESFKNAKECSGISPLIFFWNRQVVSTTR